MVITFEIKNVVSQVCHPHIEIELKNKDCPKNTSTLRPAQRYGWIVMEGWFQQMEELQQEGTVQGDLYQAFVICKVLVREPVIRKDENVIENGTVLKYFGVD